MNEKHLGNRTRQERRKAWRQVFGNALEKPLKPSLHDFQKGETVLYTKHAGTGIAAILEARIAIQHKASTAEILITYWDSGWRWTTTNYQNLKRR